MMSWLLTTVLLAVAPESGATIQGFVRVEDSREPVAYATVSITALNRAVQTDTHGFFVLSGVPGGHWRIEASALGYRANGLTVVTSEKATVRLDFDLKLRPLLVPGI